MESNKCQRSAKDEGQSFVRQVGGRQDLQGNSLHSYKYNKLWVYSIRAPHEGDEDIIQSITSYKLLTELYIFDQMCWPA